MAVNSDDGDAEPLEDGRLEDESIEDPTESDVSAGEQNLLVPRRSGGSPMTVSEIRETFSGLSALESAVTAMRDLVPSGLLDDSTLKLVEGVRNSVLPSLLDRDDFAKQVAVLAQGGDWTKVLGQTSFENLGLKGLIPDLIDRGTLAKQVAPLLALQGDWSKVLGEGAVDKLGLALGGGAFDQLGLKALSTSAFGSQSLGQRCRSSL